MRTTPALLTALALAACGGGSSTPDAGSACRGAAKTPANLVKDPGFECGGSETGWAPIYGDFTIADEGHTGIHAGKLTVSAGNMGRFGSDGPVVTNTSGVQKIYCAVAWMKGTATDGVLSVMEDVNLQEYRFTSPLGAQWARLPYSTNLKVIAPPGAKVYLKFTPRDEIAGQTILVDDVDLWESTTPECSETRPSGSPGLP